jgi:hypothetical protein
MSAGQGQEQDGRAGMERVGARGVEERAEQTAEDDVGGGQRRAAGWDERPERSLDPQLASTQACEAGSLTAREQAPQFSRDCTNPTTPCRDAGMRREHPYRDCGDRGAPCRLTYTVVASWVLGSGFYGQPPAPCAESRKGRRGLSPSR